MTAVSNPRPCWGCGESDLELALGGFSPKHLLILAHYSLVIADNIASQAGAFAALGHDAKLVADVPHSGSPLSHCRNDLSIRDAFA